ncbi:MAG TPA: hypothetical protein VE219_06460 [Candidatus Sulfotelmatobacter sp.]|nr:hypothetical protein [Candidatus Sulfotelmatobacter sp.]
MGQAVDQAKHERELTKDALEANVGRLESKVRAELDWRARLRRDGPRYAVLAGSAVLIVGGGIALRIMVSRARSHNRRATGPAPTLDGIVRELRALRSEVEAGRGKGAGGPLWQKVMLRAVAAGGATGGAVIARTLMERFTEPQQSRSTAQDGWRRS